MTYTTDYYQILQVHREAEPEVIQAAYRKLAAKYHPDINKAPDAAQRTAQINNAYEVLSDPHQRADYDAITHIHRRRVRTSSAKNNNALLKNLVFLIAMTLVLFVIPRFGVSLLLAFTRFGVPLLVLGLVCWLVYTFTKPRQ
jgi:curved DNA-binding protein CbpA